ncbi:MAG: hypothetical protein IKM38_01755 [Christensenellaceae bacterium]|nr:hypothetical protein [Christensenellaceae bacterium]
MSFQNFQEMVEQIPQELLGMAFILLLILFIPLFLFCIALYCFHSNALYTIAKRRRLRHCWMAWCPILSSYILGEIADQQLLAEGKNDRNYRMVYTVIQIVSIVFSFVAFLVSKGAFDIFETLNSLIGIVLLVYQALIFDRILRSLYGPHHAGLLVCSILFGAIVQTFALYLKKESDLGVPLNIPSASNMNTI